MKKLKKIGCSILSLVLLAAFAVGCTDTQKTDSDMKTATVWSGNSHSKAVMEQLVEEFNITTGKEWKVQIDYVVKEGDSADAINLAYETDEEPDFASVGSIEKYIDADELVAINDLPGGEEFLNTYDPTSYANFTFDGKTYKAPYGATTVGLVYNKDMFKKYGLVDENGEAKPPATYTEMREYAKIMTNPDEGEYGIIIPLGNQWLYTTDIAGVTKASANFREYDWTTGQYNFDDQKPLYEMYLGIKADGSYFPGADNIDNDVARARFDEGKIGMKFGASYDVGVYNDQFPAKCDWGVAPHPTAEENVRYANEISGSGFLVINKKAVENLGEELAMKIFAWFHDDAMMKKLYEAGMEIPFKPEIIADADIENAKHGWKEFAELMSIHTTLSWQTPKSIRTGQKAPTDYFLQDIWTEKRTVDEVIAEMNKSYNDGMAVWFEQNPDKQPEDYIDKSLDTRVD